MATASTSEPISAPRASGPGLPTGLMLTLAINNAVPAVATDMYTPAFPLVTADLGAATSLIGLSLTTFFVGFALGQFVGGPISDQLGRRRMLLIGAVIYTLASIGCAIAPGIWALIAARALQGLGGGIAAAVARAVVVDLAHGPQLARSMSILMALGGLAPMSAPLIGAGVLLVTDSWRAVFWALTALGLVMMVAVLRLVPESLRPEDRHSGGVGVALHHMREVFRIRAFVGHLLIATFAAFTIVAYIANGSFLLQESKGLSATTFALFFGSTALAQVLLSFLNARLVLRMDPRRLIGAGLLAQSIAIGGLLVGVLVLETPLALTCAGFFVLMAAQGLVVGNASSLAVSHARHVAGTASGLIGVAVSLGWAVSAPLATLPASNPALPMALVMAIGVLGSIIAFRTTARQAA